MARHHRSDLLGRPALSFLPLVRIEMVTDERESKESSLSRCRVAPYLIKATALRAAAPTAHAPGVRPCRAEPPRRGGQSGKMPC
jgi:hypothetical protein